MNWTTFPDFQKDLTRLWEKGRLLAGIINETNLFPLRLPLKKPSSTDVSRKFSATREWIAEVRKAEARGCRIVWRDVNHRVIGQNSLPEQLWVDSLDTAATIIGKRADVDEFRRISNETQSRRPELMPWLERYPLQALKAAEKWTRLLDVVEWLQKNPRPGIYVRQVDIAGVDSKFIEDNRSTLSQLLELALPSQAINVQHLGRSGFMRRYGFREKPLRVRFRILDRALAVFASGEDEDIEIPSPLFAKLALPAKRVFITENETNFLAFPLVAQSIVIFGGGYGFDMLAQARWLNDCEMHYWGDIDTNGFAILDQLRARMPHAKSLLMDRQTLLQHRGHWGRESCPKCQGLPRLNKSEADVYDDLRFNRLAQQLRLEQERIGFSFVQKTLSKILQET